MTGRPFKREDITPEVVREFFDYDPESGKLFWKERARKWFTAENAFKIWNKRYAGTEAFTSVSPLGYLRGGILWHKFQAHRVAYAHYHGVWPENEVDHIDGDPGNNRISNLRDVSHVQNQRNMKRASDNKSGHVGVNWHKASRKWRSFITVRGKVLHLGLFEQLPGAVSARKAAEGRYGFSASHGRAA